jgi:hypothetical protein
MIPLIPLISLHFDSSVYHFLFLFFSCCSCSHFNSTKSFGLGLHIECHLFHSALPASGGPSMENTLYLQVMLMMAVRAHCARCPLSRVLCLSLASTSFSLLTCVSLELCDSGLFFFSKRTKSSSSCCCSFHLAF